MNKRPAETRDDFSKMKNLCQVNQNPEDEALDGEKERKESGRGVFISCFCTSAAHFRNFAGWFIPSRVQ